MIEFLIQIFNMLLYPGGIITIIIGILVIIDRFFPPDFVIVEFHTGFNIYGYERNKLNESKDGFIKIKTGGQWNCYVNLYDNPGELSFQQYIRKDYQSDEIDLIKHPKKKQGMYIRRGEPVWIDFKLRADKPIKDIAEFTVAGEKIRVFPGIYFKSTVKKLKLQFNTKK